MPSIRSIRVHEAAIRLRHRIRHASHDRTANQTLLVRTELSDGAVGWGEGLPREYVTGETIDTAWRHAAGLQQFVGRSVESPADCIPLIDTLRFDGDDPRGCLGNSVRCAWDISLLDAASRSTGQPIGAVLEDIVPAAMRVSARRLRYSPVLPAASTRRKAVWRAVRMRAWDMRGIKLKLGIDGHDDETTLRRYRRWLGRRITRVDANEAWTADELPGKLAMLARNGVYLCEQPLPHAAMSTVQGIRRAGQPVAIMLDESFCSASDLAAALGQNEASAFNIRLSKCGGLVASARLYREIQQASVERDQPLGVMLGCQVGETAILSAAGRAFASPLPEIGYVEGSYDRYLVHDALSGEDITFARGGWADPLTGPGLGVTIDEEAVERVTARRREFA